ISTELNQSLVIELGGALAAGSRSSGRNRLPVRPGGRGGASLNSPAACRRRPVVPRRRMRDSLRAGLEKGPTACGVRREDDLVKFVDYAAKNSILRIQGDRGSLIVRRCGNVRIGRCGASRRVPPLTWGPDEEPAVPPRPGRRWPGPIDRCRLPGG